MLSTPPSPQPESSTAPTPSPSAISPTDQELLKALLAGRDITCGRCGYNLRGNTKTACPECGEILALPTTLGAVLGYGPGSLVIWLAPLSLFGSVLIGIAGNHGDGGFAMMLLAVMLPAIVLSLVALKGHFSPITARTRLTYWYCARVAAMLYAAGIAVLFLLFVV